MSAYITNALMHYEQKITFGAEDEILADGHQGR